MRCPASLDGALERRGLAATAGAPWIETANVRLPTWTRSRSFNWQDVGQRLAVDERAVAAAEVPDDDRVRPDGELRVLAADLLAVGPQVAGLAAADLEDGAQQGDDLPLGFALDDDELHFHGNRPNLEGLRRKGRRAYGEGAGGNSRRARRPRQDQSGRPGDRQCPQRRHREKSIISASDDLTRGGPPADPASPARMLATEELSRRNRWRGRTRPRRSSPGILTRFPPKPRRHTASPSNLTIGGIPSAVEPLCGHLRGAQRRRVQDGSRVDFPPEDLRAAAGRRRRRRPVGRRARGPRGCSRAAGSTRSARPSGRGRGRPRPGVGDRRPSGQEHRTVLEQGARDAVVGAADELEAPRTRYPRRLRSVKQKTDDPARRTPATRPADRPRSPASPRTSAMAAWTAR